jgi:hypothetical protein
VPRELMKGLHSVRRGRDDFDSEMLSSRYRPVSPPFFDITASPTTLQKVSPFARAQIHTKPDPVTHSRVPSLRPCGDSGDDDECAGSGSRTSRVLARHCRMEFMKHVLPRLDSPLGMDGPRGMRDLDAESELEANGGVRTELHADGNDVDVDGLDVELVLRPSDGERWVLS